MITHRISQRAWLAAALATASVPAFAQTAAPAATTTDTAPAAAAADEPPPGLWINGIHFSAQIQSGIIANPYRPNTGLNFGQLFTDHANQVQMNQLLLTANKPLDPKNSDFQWGFKAQIMYGSDARYTQFLGELNRVDPNQRYQLDVVEANLLFHLPVLTSGGVDLKVGQYPTPLGFEVIDPSLNPFYSHSYIFQFGLPFKHTGALATTHVNDTLDIYTGIDTGTNTTWGPLGDNNAAVGGIAGFGLNGLMGGNMTIIGLTHVGPEQATRLLSGTNYANGLSTVNANGQWRSFSDIVVTWKLSDSFTSTTELNWVRDAYGTANKPVNAFGVAQYFSYALTDTLTLNTRFELFRDDNNFFVAQFSGNSQFVGTQQGFVYPAGVYTAGAGSTTYSAFTVGVTYKPSLPAPISGLLIRPEVRWDHALTDNAPFNLNTNNPTKNTFNSVTFGADLVLTF